MNFDANDPLNIGRPLFWNLEDHIKAVEGMIKSDEIQIALRMCDEVPSFYRTKVNYPVQLTEIKKKVYRQCYDIFLYGNDPEEASQTRETAESQWLGGYCFPRGEIITNEIRTLNMAGITPWLFDLSCSHGNALAGLIKTEVKFKYLGKSMNSRAAERVKEWAGDVWQDLPEKGQETILISTEALEHAWDSGDIVRAAYKMNIDYDQIFLSTPLNTLGGGLENYDTRPLGHVRCYNSEEFSRFAEESFSGYSWALYLSHSQVLHGKKT